MDDQAGVTLIQVEAPALPEPHHQLQHRDHEGAGKHQTAPAHRCQRFEAAQVIQRFDPRSFIACAVGPACAALAVQHDHHHQQQQAGQLCGSRKTEEAVPGFVDRRRERVEVEHRHRTEIRQGFHQRQRHARTDGRACHRQRDAPERLPRRLPQDSRRFHQAFALSEKCRARQQVNVGIEDQYQNEDDAAGRADSRQSQARAEPFAHQRLNGTGKIQQSDEDERQHVGRNRERQHQRPVQPAPTGEFAEAGEPGEADTQQRYAGTDAKHQGQRVAQQPRHLRVPEVGPDLMIDGLPGEQQNAEGQQDQRSDGEDQGIPAALGGVGQGQSSLNDEMVRIGSG
ncbi:hypothetical protein D3C84_499860 [compost metagenome]